jgi:hypothetical protein
MHKSFVIVPLALASWLLVALIAVAALSLVGCTSQMSGSTYTDGRFLYFNAKSASDAAGGPRQDIIIVTDLQGNLIEKTTAAGPGTLQTVVGAASAVISAGGQVAGSALLRPARNNTSSTINGGSGTSSSTAGSTAGSTSTGNGTVP